MQSNAFRMRKQHGLLRDFMGGKGNELLQVQKKLLL